MNDDSTTWPTTVGDDDELMRMLADVLGRTEPISTDAVETAYAAPDLAHVDEELAALVFDSTDQLVTMRGTATETRLVSFANDRLTIDLELHTDGVTVVGQLTPVVDEPLEVEAGDEPATEVDVDAHGRFRIVTTTGPVRLRVVGRLVTPWITR